MGNWTLHLEKLKDWRYQTDYGDALCSKSINKGEPSQHEPGAKLDAGKTPFHFLKYFKRSLAAVSFHAAGGAKKYSPGGFLEVDNGQERYEDAMLRHYFEDDLVDEDHSEWVGQETLHATAVAWNALAQLEFILINEEREKNGS